MSVGEVDIFLVEDRSPLEGSPCIAIEHGTNFLPWGSCSYRESFDR